MATAQKKDNFGFLTDLNIEAKIIEEIMGAVQKTELPDRVIIKPASVSNCSSSKQTSSHTLSASSTLSRTLAITKGVSTGQTIRVNMGFKFGPTESNFSGSAGYTTTRSFSTSESKSESSSESVNYSETYQRVAAPYTKLNSELRVIERPLRLPFKIEILVDGTLATNLAGINKISDVLTSQDLTFFVEGYFQADLSSETDLIYYETELGEEFCKNEERIKNEDTKQLVHQIMPSSPNFLDNPVSEINLKSNKVLLLENRKNNDFVAFGEHKCSSETSEYYCRTPVQIFSECSIASSTLAEMSCCSSSPNNIAKSSEFELKYCEPL